MSKNWFDISNEGWRRMNAGRPPHELVKELIQNVLDENFNAAYINFGMKNGEFHLTIEDDVNGGIANSSLITTVFLTGKEESHLKRGRKGRGLKEFLSVCYEAEVETVGKTIRFLEDGSREEKENGRTIGTKISCKIREEKWNEESVKEIENYLRMVILYTDGMLNINGKNLTKRTPICSFGSDLMTHIVENGIQQDIRKNTIVSMYHKALKKGKGWIYEMGIPVAETKIPYDIDIQQRIPMNDNRNEVNEYYLRDIKESILINEIDRLTKMDLIDWAANNISIYGISNIIQKKIVEKITNEDSKNLSIKSKPKFNDKAKQRGKKLVDVDGMNYSLKSIFEHIVDYSEAYIGKIERETKPIICDPTEGEQLFIEEHKKITRGIGLDVEFRIVEKKKDTSGFVTMAFYTNENCHVISYNRLAMGKILKDPYNEQAIDTLIHELGHTEEDQHDKMKYVDAVTKIGAKIVLFLMKKTVAVKKDTGKTVMESVKEVLSEGVYISLEDIYSKLNAQTTGEKAGIRGVLNRNCPVVFERHPEGGKYKICY